ncbi:coiled-coil domain-containing protein 110-like isoform X3 [Acipenser ruthenus]|uniref:coiled-coil domain-containing protein 110-like isoform X3 n=1 Tax=Acipenser ruthenus TaxID=7906 RepID=UPI0027416B55|nr:coiled-coil domain-containing protein 110-like isoform X3 [Acipenser ruthenus]
MRRLCAQRMRDLCCQFRLRSSSLPFSDRDGRNVPQSTQEGSLKSQSTDATDILMDNTSATMNNNLSHNITSPSQKSFKSVVTMKMGSMVKDNRNAVSEKTDVINCLNVPQGVETFNIVLAGSTVLDRAGPMHICSAEKTAVNGNVLSLSECNDDLWGTLEKISITSEQMKVEMDKSQTREIALALNLQHLKHTIRLLPKGSRDQKSFEGTDAKSKIFVSNKIDGIQKSTTSLKENSLNLHKDIQSGSAGSSPSHHCDNGTSQTNQGTEIKNQATTNSDKSESMSSMRMENLQSPGHVNHLENQKEVLSPINGKSNKPKDLSSKSVLTLSQLKHSSKDLRLLEENLLNFEDDNLSLKSEVNRLKVLTETLKEQNIVKESTIVQLEEEKKDLQSRLKKTEADSKEYVKELKKLLYKYDKVRIHYKTLDEERRRLTSEQKTFIHLLDSIKEEQQRAHDKMLSVVNEKDQIKEVLETTNKNFLQVKDEKLMLQRKVIRMMEEINLMEKELGSNQLESQQLKERGAALRSEKETLLQVLQEIKDEKLTLDMTLQDSANTIRTLQKEVKSLSSQKSATEKKLQDEMHKVQADRVFNSVAKECEVLSVEVANLKEDNNFLKQELEQHIQEGLQLRGNMSRLKEECKRMENCLLTVQNEKEILQVELRQFHKDCLGLRNVTGAHLGSKTHDTSSSSLGSKEMSYFKDGVSSHHSPEGHPCDFSWLEKGHSTPGLTERTFDEVRKRFEEEEWQKTLSFNKMGLGQPQKICKLDLLCMDNFLQDKHGDGCESPRTNTQEEESDDTDSSFYKLPCLRRDLHHPAVMAYEDSKEKIQR